MNTKNAQKLLCLIAELGVNERPRAAAAVELTADGAAGRDVQSVWVECAVESVRKPTNAAAIRCPIAVLITGKCPYIHESNFDLTRLRAAWTKWMLNLFSF